MMSKTHIAVGVASSLAVCRPQTWGETIASVIGGAVGGILCDIDCRATPKVRDAVYGRFIAVALAVFLLAADGYFKTGLCISVMNRPFYSLTVAFVVLFIAFSAGIFSRHRSFAHSLLFVLMMGFGFFCVTPMLLFPMLAGGLSHLILDTLNKKPVPWLWPLSKKGFCLKLFYANKTADKAMLWTAAAACAVLLAWRISVLI